MTSLPYQKVNTGNSSLLYKSEADQGQVKPLASVRAGARTRAAGGLARCGA